MNHKLLPFLAIFCAPVLSQAQLGPDGATASWLGSLPPKAVADISAEQQATLEKELAEATAAFQAVNKHPNAADAHIFLKAVRYAIDFHEWYDKKAEDNVKKAQGLLEEARERIDSLSRNETPWMNGPGSKVLGFYSGIDDSPQPYGVEVPEGLEWGKGKKQIPMWVWLHGRGDTSTDINFIASRMRSKGGEFKPKSAIVVHPFGRYCNGFKSAGETDVFECRWDAMKRFNADYRRVALMGFSMGGAGAWHIGAHFADQWTVVHTGAGFVDVKRYQNLTPEKMPVTYEQTLWGVYDVPDYARNFYNVPLISYSGEVDKQRDSAEYMTEVFDKIGYKRPHLIGPGMGHKYDPAVRDQVAAFVEEKVSQGRDVFPARVSLQFRSARYSRMNWVQVLEVDEPFANTCVDAEIMPDTDQLHVITKNVRTLKMDVPFLLGGATRQMVIDGEGYEVIDPRPFKPGGGNTLTYYANRSAEGKWVITADDARKPGPTKSGGTCIEDAFLGRFVIVLPDKPGRSPQTDAWVKAESEHFIQRWRRLMRGDPLVAKASEVGTDRATEENLILWGDDKSNAAIAQRAALLPVKWEGDEVTVGGQKFAAATHVPVLIYPDVPYQEGQRSIVLNSGLTFREGHDKTNSLQNPKLPDWAILDITTPPDALSPGKVVAADFFDAHWQFKKTK